MAIIYKITNPTNGRVYIGHTIRTVKLRMYSHRAKLRSGSHIPDMQSDYNEIGWEGFKVEVVEETEKALEREQHWITHYGDIAYNRQNALGKVTLTPEVLNERTKRLRNRLRKRKRF